MNLPDYLRDMADDESLELSDEKRAALTRAATALAKAREALTIAADDLRAMKEASDGTRRSYAASAEESARAALAALKE